MSTSKIDTGGPAFPIPDTENSLGDGGMSLRQWYAGQVITGMYADTNITWDLENMADQAFKQADAMIARGKK